LTNTFIIHFTYYTPRFHQLCGNANIDHYYDDSGASVISHDAGIRFYGDCGFTG
jgi:hypothetical protein